MEKYFFVNKTLKGFNPFNEYSKITSYGIMDIVNIIDILKKIRKDENLIKFKIYKDQIVYLKSLKKYYIISFSSIIIMTSLGLTVNEILF